MSDLSPRVIDARIDHIRHDHPSARRTTSPATSAPHNPAIEGTSAAERTAAGADAVVTPIRGRRYLGVSDRAKAVRRTLRAFCDETGAATAEYAIVVLAAVGFAGLLVVILRGNEVKSMLTDVIQRALSGG